MTRRRCPPLPQRNGISAQALAALSPPAEASRRRAKPELNQSAALFCGAEVRVCGAKRGEDIQVYLQHSEPGLRQSSGRCGTPWRVFGHIYRTAWIHLNKGCKSHLKITANTPTADPSPDFSLNTSQGPCRLVVCRATTALRSPTSFFGAKPKLWSFGAFV